MANLLRPARPGDEHGVSRCVTAAYGHYVARIGRAPGPMLDDYAHVLAAHDVHVIDRDGRIAAVLVLIGRGDGVLLDNIAVHPDYQGEGLGARLLEFAEARVAAMGITSLDLYSHELMQENIAWYARRGYRELRRVREKGFNRVYMRKQLASGG